MLTTLSNRSSLVVDLGVLVLEVEIPFLLSDVAHNSTLPILVHHEALLRRSENVRVMMHYRRLVKDFP